MSVLKCSLYLQKEELRYMCIQRRYMYMYLSAYCCTLCDILTPTHCIVPGISSL